MTANPSLSAIAISLLFAAPAFAEEQAPNEQAPAIVVTGRGLDATPATPAYDVQTITRERLVATGSGRIEDALSSVAGFQQFRRSDSRSSNPTAQGATLRALGGNASSRTLVLLDGVPMSDPFFGYIPYSALSPERLDSVRVTRGGGSGAFGAGAVAGTIEMQSADANTLGLASGGVLVNDRGETETTASFAPKLGDGFAVISGRWDRGQGFYTTPKGQRSPATARAKYESWSIGGRVVQPLTDTVELQARALFFEDKRTLRFKGANSSIEGQDVSLRLVGRGDWQFDVLAYGQWRDFTNIVISSSTFNPTLDQHDTPASGLGGKIEIRPPVGEDHVLRLGADYRRSHGRMEETGYSATTLGLVTRETRAGGTNTDLGFFLEDDWTLGPVVLTAGGRLDRYSISEGFFVQTQSFADRNTSYAKRSEWEPTFRGGMVAQVATGVQLRGAAYTGIRLPTLNELYRPFVVFPITTLANENLGVEKLRGFEGGIDYSPAKGVNLSVTAFDNKLKGAIANVTIGENLKQRLNVDAVHAKGLEFGAALDLGQVSLNGSLAYTDSKVKASGTGLDGMRPSQTPKWAMSGTLSYRPRDNWLFAATLRHIGKQFEDDREVDALKSVTTLDAFAQVMLVDKLSFVLRGENLFDEEIQTRNQTNALGFPSIDLGTPRTVWAGIRYGF
jgi:outer membrane receptor protein involved in Fe transport